MHSIQVLTRNVWQKRSRAFYLEAIIEHFDENRRVSHAISVGAMGTCVYHGLVPCELRILLRCKNFPPVPSLEKVRN